MADYEVIVEFESVVAGGDMTAAQIRDALETLSGNDRLDASAIKNLPNAEDVLTIPEIVTGLEALTGSNRLSATALKNLTKSIVTGAEKALNYRATGNVWSSTFQSASMTSIYAWDMFIASSIDTSLNGTTVETGDWCIALTATPGFDFTNTAKWYILKISKIPDYSPAFKKRSESVQYSGIESYPIDDYGAIGYGLYSFAVGKQTIALDQATTAQGDNSAATRYASRALAGGKIAYRGDAQVQDFVMRCQTTDATPTEVTLPESYVFANGKTYKLKIEVVARLKDGAKSKSWEWNQLVSMTSTALVTPTLDTSVTTAQTIDIGSFSGSATVTYNKTPLPARLIITVTGIAASVVNWAIFIHAVEIFTTDSSGDVFTAVNTGMITAPTYVD